MRILVTGSSGQIGSYVIDVAREQGHETVGLDLRPNERWTDVVGDIREAKVCQDAISGCDAVIHCAAQVSVQQSIEDPAEDASHNVLGTINLLEAAREEGVARFVNTSSAAVYGEPHYLPIDEKHPTRPLSPYGQSKLSAEGYARLCRDLHGLDVVTVRPFNVYSPRQDPSSPYSGVISKFAERVRAGKPPVVFGDGSQTRDFVHAEDVARWMVRLTTVKGAPSVNVVNLGTGEETSIRDLARSFLREAGCLEPPEFAPALEGEVPRSVASIQRASSLLLTPSRTLENAMGDLLSVGRDQPID